MATPQERARTQLIVALVATQLIALLAIVLATRPFVFARHQMDLSIYYQYALELTRGKAPYRDFAMEYPPLALLPFVLPWLAAVGRSLDFGAYVRLFVLQNVVLSTLVALAISWVLRCWRPQRPVGPPLTIYTLLVAVTAPLLPWRYDLFPALLTLLALLCALRGQPAWAGAWLGVGVAVKLYPVVLLPVFGAYYLAGGRTSMSHRRMDEQATVGRAGPPPGWRALLRLTLGCIGALALTVLPFLAIAPAELASFLRYHQMRGLQVESLPAGAIMLAHVFGLAGARLDFNYGALHLVSPLAAPALRWLPFAFIAVFGSMLASCLARFCEERASSRGAISHETLAAYSVAALLAFIVTNKVFSPQYLIWLLPFAPLLRPRYAGVFLAICAITIRLFPFDYDNLLAMQLPPVLLLNLRNLLIVALLVWLLIAYMPAFVRAAFVARGQQSGAPESPGR